MFFGARSSLKQKIECLVAKLQRIFCICKSDFHNWPAPERVFEWQVAELFVWPQDGVWQDHLFGQPLSDDLEHVCVTDSFPPRVLIKEILMTTKSLLPLSFMTVMSVIMNSKPDQPPTSRTPYPWSSPWSASPTSPFPWVLLPDQDGDGLASMLTTFRGSKKTSPSWLRSQGPPSSLLHTLQWATSEMSPLSSQCVSTHQPKPGHGIHLNWEELISLSVY